MPIGAAEFWSRVDKTGDCWLWTKSTTVAGYGQQWFPIGSQMRMWKAHRLAWFLTNGAIPEGQCVCHRCDNPLCVRPEHLFLGTQRENLRDMQRKGRNYTNPVGGWRGSRNIRAKLTEADVRTIRSEYAAGSSLRKLSKKFGIAHTAIASVLHRRTWAHVV